ncbi:hypothetical protein HX810_09860 [Pseudomonas salomonii]|uniref:Uncharacterized protein n=1 Tax=Pseudomonas salomonii TaxID=191391 RepID=A0A7Y8GDF4_9PSED|nr:hypothetical protein [Pseudomonas salomonii]NWF07968.1 hypothetical protein [Pseudomonas salomonii]
MNICATITEVDWALTKDIFGILGTVISTAGVVAACYFGSRGLTAWKKQLRGNFDHALAVKVLVELYKFRDSIIDARAPMFTYESLNFNKSPMPKEAAHKEYRVISESLTARYDKVSTIRVQLEAAAFECEAVWGAFLKAPIAEIFMLLGELVREAQRYKYLSNPEISEEGKKFYSMFNGERTNIIFDDRRAESDAFNIRFDAALKALEGHLKKKLTD